LSASRKLGEEGGLDPSSDQKVGISVIVALIVLVLALDPRMLLAIVAFPASTEVENEDDDEDVSEVPTPR
jgi:hypothetical protein